MPIQIYDLNLDKKNRELEVRGTPLFPCGAYFSDIISNVTGDIPCTGTMNSKSLSLRKVQLKLASAELITYFKQVKDYLLTPMFYTQSMSLMINLVY